MCYLSSIDVIYPIISNLTKCPIHFWLLLHQWFLAILSGLNNIFPVLRLVQHRVCQQWWHDVSDEKVVGDSTLWWLWHYIRKQLHFDFLFTLGSESTFTHQVRSKHLYNHALNRTMISIIIWIRVNVRQRKVDRIKIYIYITT